MKLKYTDEQIAYFKKMGRKGGKKTKKLYGSSHYKRIATKNGNPPINTRKSKRESN